MGSSRIIDRKVYYGKLMDKQNKCKKKKKKKLVGLKMSHRKEE